MKTQKEKKNSFVLYHSYAKHINRLSDEQVGKLMRCVFHYSETGEILELEPLLEVAFNFIREDIDINKQKWEDMKEVRSEAGRRGAEARWNKGDDDKKKMANDGKRILPMANDGKDAVSVSVSVSGSVKKNISKDIGDASYGDNYINILTEWFQKEYPHPLTGLSDRRRLQNLKQIMTPRKNKDKWMSSNPRENTKKFLMDYFIYQPEDQYKVRSIYKLIDIAKQWREQEGVLVNETTEDIKKDRYMVENQKKWQAKKESERKAYEN